MEVTWVPLKEWGLSWRSKKLICVGSFVWCLSHNKQSVQGSRSYLSVRQVPFSSFLHIYALSLRGGDFHPLPHFWPPLQPYTHSSPCESCQSNSPAMEITRSCFTGVCVCGGGGGSLHIKETHVLYTLCPPPGSRWVRTAHSFSGHTRTCGSQVQV